MGTEVSQVAALLWKDVGAGVGPHRHAHKQRRECIREATQSSGRYCSVTLGASEKKKKRGLGFYTSAGLIPGSCAGG